MKPLIQGSGNCTGLFNAGRAVDPTTGNRTYSALNYFIPNIERTNLLVLTGAQVSLAVFSGQAQGRRGIICVGDEGQRARAYHRSSSGDWYSI